MVIAAFAIHIFRAASVSHSSLPFIAPSGVKLCWDVMWYCSLHASLGHLQAEKLWLFYTIQLFIAALILLALYQEQDEKLSELESENRKMKLELEEYRSEATHLRNQQATIRRLEDRNRQLEQQVSGMLVLLFFFACLSPFPYWHERRGFWLLSSYKVSLQFFSRNLVFFSTCRAGKYLVSCS